MLIREFPRKRRVHPGTICEFSPLLRRLKRRETASRQGGLGGHVAEPMCVQLSLVQPQQNRNKSFIKHREENA